MITKKGSNKTSFSVWVLMLSISMGINAQNLTTTQTEHLFKAGQLWGHLTYFHPYLQYKKIAFDSAYAASVPKILAAQSDTDFSNALNEWLSILDDAITRAEVKPKTQSVAQTFKAQIQNKKDIGVLTLSGGMSDWNTVLETMSSITDTLSTFKGLVFDCRELTEDFGWLLDYSGVQNQLFNGTITTLGTRKIAHSGFVPETGGTSGEYQTYFKNYSPQTLKGKSKKEIPVVFIVSPKTILPEVAWAMHKAGKATIISNGQLLDKQNALSYPITEGVTVSIRINETLTGSTHADLILDNNDKNALIDKAFELLEKKDFKAQATANNLGLELIEKNPNYTKEKYPTLGYRALAVAKIYAVINNFFPNKKLMTVDWDSVTQQYLSSIVLAKDSAEFQFGVSALYAHIQDGHGFMSGLLITKILVGGNEGSPILGEVVEGKFVVTTIVNDSLAKNLGIQKGDIILKRNGKDVFELIKTKKKYLAFSNDVTGTAYAASIICRGTDNTEGVFTIQKRDSKIVDIKVPFDKKLTQSSLEKGSGRSNEKILRFLNPEIGYADLDRLESSSVDSMFDMFKNTKAIVFDMRGYPKGTAWTIAPRLTAKKYVPAAKFTRLDIDLPKIVSSNTEVGSSETWTNFIQNIPSTDTQKGQYKGKTVMLVNEHTQSQAEHTGLFFRAANGTKFIGSQTAGANGDVTNFTIPGGLTLYFSGQTVWFPDGTQLQRTGLKPDIFVRPTIKGIQADKDEVLERAIKYLQTGQ
jgi:C-terminal processing protease CtpA/Prc